jgi:hypothetical protein
MAVGILTTQIQPMTSASVGVIVASDSLTSTEYTLTWNGEGAPTNPLYLGLFVDNIGGADKFKLYWVEVDYTMEWDWDISS